MDDRVKERLSRLPRAMDELLFPEHVGCLGCGMALGEDERDGLCPTCVQALTRQEEAQRRREEQGAFEKDGLPEGIAYVHAAFGYEGVARRLILSLKFSSVRAAAIPLARAMTALPGGEEEIIVPVPTTERRLRQRGYNQAEVLAQRVGEELGMRVVCALTRRDEHVAQMTLTRAQRAKNLVGSMSATGEVCARRVLLVDDVYTTGSTAKEAARALYAAGAAGVSVFVAARTLPVGQNEPKFLRRWDKMPDFPTKYLRNCEKLSKTACNFSAFRL